MDAQDTAANPVCRRLRTKMYYVVGRDHPNLRVSSPTAQYWCSHTTTVMGLDRRSRSCKSIPDDDDVYRLVPRLDPCVHHTPQRLVSCSCYRMISAIQSPDNASVNRRGVEGLTGAGRETL